MRKALIVAALMSFGVYSAAMASGKDNCNAAFTSCNNACFKISDTDAKANCLDQCGVGFDFCHGFTNKPPLRTNTSSGGPGNLKDIPGASGGKTAPASDTHGGVSSNGNSANAGTFGAIGGAAAPAPASKPSKPIPTLSNEIGGGAPAPAPHSSNGRSNLRAQ